MNLQDLVINNAVKIEQDAQANTITIIASDSSEKLSNLIKDFPDNCYVNKQIIDVMCRIKLGVIQILKH